MPEFGPRAEANIAALSGATPFSDERRCGEGVVDGHD
jgi:hypothetical protein